MDPDRLEGSRYPSPCPSHCLFPGMWPISSLGPEQPGGAGPRSPAERVSPDAKPGLSLPFSLFRLQGGLSSPCTQGV